MALREHFDVRRTPAVGRLLVRLLLIRLEWRGHDEPLREVAREE